MDKIFFGGALGFLLGCISYAIFTVLSPVYLPNAQSNYTRCISDGGTQEHCVGKYLLPQKDVK